MLLRQISSVTNRLNLGRVQNRTFSPNCTKRLNPAFPPVDTAKRTIEPPLVMTFCARRKFGLFPTNTIRSVDRVRIEAANVARAEYRLAVVKTFYRSARN